MKAINKKIIKPIGRKTKQIVRTIDKTFSVPTQISSTVKEILKKYGNEVIKGIVLKRTPVSGLIVGALDAVSLGKFGKRMEKNDLDNLYHLFMDIYTENNQVVSLEKNAGVNMIVNPSRRDKEEKQSVSNIPQGITINQLIQNGINRMGNQFFRYDSKVNNCQDFLLNILQANGIGDQSDYEFIKQKTEKLFKGLPVLKGIAHAITDVGGIANKFIGGSLDEERIEKRNPFNNPKFVSTIKKLRNK
jgi:hypothetical protein